MDQLTKVNQECFKKGISYADYQKQMYPIKTGIHKDSAKRVEDYPDPPTREKVKKSTPITIHPGDVKANSKVILNRNSIALIESLKNKK